MRARFLSLSKSMLLLLFVLTSLAVCFSAVSTVEGQVNPADSNPDVNSNPDGGHQISHAHKMLSKLMMNNPEIVPVNPELLAAVSEQLRAANTEPPPPESLANPELSALGASSALLPESPLANSTVLPHSPQFVVRLPDKNLLCFSIEGFELFTYNLITSNYLVLNGFLNLTSIPAVDGFTQMRGFGDIGMIIKAMDRRIKAGKRFFKHLIYGERKKAIMQGFGEVDMKGGAILFSLKDGHSNIESQQSAHEQFRLKLDKPQADIFIVSNNGHTFNVYVEDSTGLVGIEMHGLIGQFINSKVRISTTYKELHLADKRVVPLREGKIWKDVPDNYSGRNCWYPVEGENIIEGEPYQYIVEHIMSTKYKYSLFTKK